MENTFLIEELNVRGYSIIDDFRLSDEEIAWFKNDMIFRKNQEIDHFGEEELRRIGRYDIVRNLISFKQPYLDLIKSDWLNDIVNASLNEQAIIHDFFGMLNTANQDSNLVRNKFHRDFPSLERRRCSIHIMIPLVDATVKSGATEVVPGTHLFESHPSQEFCEKHAVSMTGVAGSVFVMDSSVIHRAGKSTLDSRPMMVMRFQLAFLKQPIDLCRAYSKYLPTSSDLINGRFGWNCRSMNNTEDDPSKWQSGQYNL